jgi:gamma-glutamyltranspeptidase/glutathione hydrolase
MTRRERLLISAAVATLAMAQTRTTMFPPVRGTREMVGAANNFEVEAGYRILTQGGNAVDAGVAATLAASVTEQSRFGIGGEAAILIKPAGKPVMAVSGAGWVPKKATAEFYRSRKPEPWETADHMAEIPAMGVLASTSPGVFDALILSLRQYGTMTFEQVSAPAIEYAEGGFPIGEEFSGFIRSTQRVLELWPASAKFFLPGGVPPNRGEIFREPTLANTFRELARAEKTAKGNRDAKLKAVRDLFYQGSIAKRFAAFSESNGGVISYDDMKSFHAETDQPRSTTYRGYQVMKPGFWTQGPVMLEALNLLEAYDLRAMEHNSPEYLHTVVEAVKLAFADRDRYYADPKFYKVPEETLLSKNYAAERRKLIDPKKASMESRPGVIGVQSPKPGPSSSAKLSTDQDTTCVNVVDRNGNVFSATPSGAWLPSVIAGDTGIPFGIRLPALLLTPGLPNTIEAGKRPRLTLSPTIVLKDGAPFLSMSTPGGDNQDQAMLQVLLNIIDFGMTPQEAVEAPRFQTEHFYATLGFHEFVAGRLNLEGRIPQAVAEKLAALGHKITVTGEWSNSSAPTVIKISGGVLDGGADPRRSRFIFGR